MKKDKTINMQQNRKVNVESPAQLRKLLSDHGIRNSKFRLTMIVPVILEEEIVYTLNKSIAEAVITFSCNDVCYDFETGDDIINKKELRNITFVIKPVEI